MPGMNFTLNTLELLAIMGVFKEEFYKLESQWLVPAFRGDRGWVCSLEELREILSEVELLSFKEYLKSTRGWK